METTYWQRLTKDINKHKGLMALAFPGLLFILVFYYLPIFGLVLAFKNYNYSDGILGSPWSGFDNFKFFFTSDAAYQVTRNTILLNLCFIILSTIFSVVFAILMFELGRKSVKVYQTAMFFPYFLSWVVVSYVTYALLNPEMGVVNMLLESFGMEAINFYFEPKYWPFILSFAYLWKSVGYALLIYYTGLMGIDRTYYEAAAIDGATRLQQVRKITLPLLTPLITLLTLLSIGKIFYSDFGLFYFIPANSGALYGTTEVIDTYVFRALRISGDIGMASAVGLYQSLVGFVLVLTVNAIVRKINKDNAIF
jgi:ABC-type polysaccharide transport system, permease component